MDFFSLSLVIMFQPLQEDEKGQHFLVPRQVVKLREISHSFLTDVQRMGTQGKCVEVHPAQNMQEVQAWGYKLLSARTLGQGTDFCLLEAIITVHIHSDQELVILTKNVRAVQGGKGKE